MNYLKKIKEVHPLIIFAAVMLIIFFPYFRGFTDLHTGLIYTDLWLFNFPLKDFFRESLLSGKLPLWTNLIGNGYPVFAEGQVGALYPLNLFFYRLFPTAEAYNLNLFTHFLLAGIFTYIFSRFSLNLSKKAALLSSFCYSLSGYFILHTHQINIDIVITYLPLAFYLAHKMIQKPVKYALYLALVFSLQILAGHMEMFYYSSILTFGFMLLSIIFSFRKEEGTKSIFIPVAGFIAALILAIGLTFVQLFPTFELNSLSQRSAGIEAGEAMQSRWPIKSLLLLINPKAMPVYTLNEEYKGTGIEDASLTEVYVYIGALAFLMALYSLVAVRSRYGVVLMIMMLVSIIYAFGNYTQLFTILWQALPGLKFFRYPSKIAFFITFALSILAALGMDAISAKFHKKYKKHKIVNDIFIAIVFISLSDLLIFNVYGFRKLVKVRDWLSPPPSALFLKDKMGDPYQYRLYSHGTNNMDYAWGRSADMQKTIQNLLPRNFNMLYGIPNNREWAVLFIETQTGLNQERTIFDFENKRLMINSSYKKSLALQNVKYLISDVPLFDKDYRQIAFFPFYKAIEHSFFLNDGRGGTQLIKIPSEGAYLYESSFYYPRSYIVGSYQVMKDDETHRLLRFLISEDFDPLTGVILEGEPNIDLDLDNGERKPVSYANIVHDRGDQIEIEAETDRNGFLFLADTYYPGWKAWVDGKEENILKANYGFRAVPITSGKHTVLMKYEPESLKTGARVSITAAVIFVILTAGNILWKRKDNRLVMSRKSETKKKIS